MNGYEQDGRSDYHDHRAGVCKSRYANLDSLITTTTKLAYVNHHNQTDSFVHVASWVELNYAV